ncbi:MAG: bifunctional heptose 7-phosphate kinase/heptose 1-phosphate adenyltransferase [Roseiflexaceae bacterium]
MNEPRLRELTGRFAGIHVLVVGDFFLDRYLVIDPAQAERSIETGLEAHQIVEVIAQPGAAGTVTANLRALGLRVTVLGLVGDDGEGHELRQGLRALGVDDGTLLTAPGHRTPTYTKPIVRAADAPPRELERLDIRTRAPTPSHATNALIARLRALAPRALAVIVADQMPAAEQGAITARVRAALTQLAEQFPDTPFLADSRTRIGEFERVIVKPNAAEAARAVWPDYTGEPDLATARQAGEVLRQRSSCPVFVTLGADGMLAISETSATHVPAIAVPGPIDVVGAGDSAMAAIAAGLCAGATLEEAALLGNLAAAITIQQLGTTGTASPEQIVEQWRAAQG